MSEEGILTLQDLLFRSWGIPRSKKLIREAPAFPSWGPGLPGEDFQRRPLQTSHSLLTPSLRAGKERRGMGGARVSLLPALVALLPADPDICIVLVLYVHHLPTSFCSLFLSLSPSSSMCMSPPLSFSLSSLSTSPPDLRYAASPSRQLVLFVANKDLQKEVCQRDADGWGKG